MPDQDIPGGQLIRLWRASDNRITVTMDPAESISGWTLAFAVTDDAGSAVAGAAKSTGAGTITISGPATGVFSFSLAPDTAGLTAGALYEYEVRRTDTDERFVIAWGQLVVK